MAPKRRESLPSSVHWRICSFYICFFPANSWQVPLAYHSFTVIIMRTVFKRCRTIIAALGKMNQNWFTFSCQEFWMNLNWFTLEHIRICMRIRFDYPPPLWAGTCFASIAFGYPQTHFWGVPQTPSLLLCDDSDADDANDAVLRISLYHIPDSASLASSASFWFCVSRNIIIFASSSSKLQASFHYKRDDDDGVRGIG